MHIWSELILRELAFVAILLMLGAAPASYLSERFDAAGRIAMTPVLGFCLGTCVTTTLLQFAPTNDTYWILLPLALGSLAIAVGRSYRRTTAPAWRQRLPLRDLGALLLVTLAVTAPVTYVLHERHTAGPAVYTYTDVDNYVGVQDAARTVSLPTARASWQHAVRTGARYGDFTQFIWSFIADFGSNLDATPLDSNVNALLGLGATDTFAPFLTVLLLAGALTAFAAVRFYSRSRTSMAAVAGCLFGGPMFLELWFDSYQAAIVALSLLLPFLMLLDCAIEARRRADLALISLLLATMLTVYPLYVTLMLGAAVLRIGWHALSARRAGQSWRALLRPVVVSALAVAVMSVVFDPVAFARDLRYYKHVLDGTLAFPRVSYHLRLSVLPGWIGQTREFWNMPPLGHADFKQLLLGGLLPIVFIGFAVVGLLRYRAALILAGLGLVCAAAAEYAYSSRQMCTYCAERNLLPLGPIVAVLIGLGLAALLAISGRRARIAALLGALLVIAAVGLRTRIELIRFANGSYFLDTANRTLLSHLPRSSRWVEEEGYGASEYGQAEQPLVYHLINERAPGRVSVLLGSDVGNALQYLNFGSVLPPGPEFHPDYRYVLTRLGSVATDRRVIARSGGIALEERVARLDVTPSAGLGASLERIDRTGTAWVQTQYPLELYVAGYNAGQPAWARLTFWAAQAVSVPAQRGVRTRSDGHVVVACIRADGVEPARKATIRIDAILHPGVAPHLLFPPATPLEGLKLTEMRAVSGHCSL